MSRFATISTAIDFSTTGLGIAGSIAAGSQAAALAAAPATAGASLAGGGAASTVAAIGSAATVIGLIAVPVIILLGRIFKGADPRQLPASYIQQIFEAAAHNVLAVGRAGMLSRAEVVDGARLFLRKGNEFYDQPEIVLGRAEEKGRARMRVNIEEVVAAAEGRPLPSPARDDFLQPPAGPAVAISRTKNLDVAGARRFYVPAGKPGWLGPDRIPEAKETSPAVAARLTDQYLNSLPKNTVEKAVSLIRSPVEEIKGVLGADTLAMLKAPISRLFPVPVWVAGAGLTLLGLALAARGGAK